jgi:putative endonuclease
MGLLRRAGPRDDVGRRGEAVAVRTLRRSGYRILGRNLRVSAGECDILALAPDRRTIVVVEVKARRMEPGSGPPPEAAVTHDKRATLARVARSLARSNGWTDRPVRVDVIAVEFPASGQPVVRHHVGAVRG